MTTFTVVSEDTYNRSQSWIFEGVYRVGLPTSGGMVVRVHIMANAYEDQSHAKVEVWRQDGWKFHTGLPTNRWYENAPSYGRKTLKPEDHDLFEDVRDELLTRLVDAIYQKRDGIEVVNE